MREDKKKRERVTHRSGTGLGGGVHGGHERDAERDKDRTPYREYRDDPHDARYDRRDDRYDRRDYHEERYDRRDDRDARYGGRYEQREERRESTPKSEPRRTVPHRGNPDRTVHQLMPYALMCLAPFAALSFILRDVMHLDGSTGAFGNFFANFLCGLFGVVGYLLPLVMLLLAIRWRRYVVRGKLAKKLILSTAFLFLLAGIIHVFKDPNRAYADTVGSVLYANGVAFEGGGFFGGFVGEWLGYCLRLWGTCLIAIPTLVVIGIYFIDMTPSGIWERLSIKLGLMRERREARQRRRYAGREESAERNAARAAQNAAAQAAGYAEPELGWCQPHALEDSVSTEPEPFRFSEEEDVLFTPVKPAQKAKPAEQEKPATEVVDIPEDIADAVEEAAAEARAATESVEVQEIVEEDPVEVLRVAAVATGMERPASVPEQPISAPAPTPVVAEQPVSASAPAPKYPRYETMGEVYAPFALPTRPFPQSNGDTVAAGTVASFGESEPKAAPSSAEEVLGIDVAAPARVTEPAPAPAFTFEEQKPATGGLTIGPLGSMPITREEQLGTQHREAAAASEPPARASAEPPKKIFSLDDIPVQEMPEVTLQKAPEPVVQAQDEPVAQHASEMPRATAGLSFLPFEEERTPASPVAPVREECEPAAPANESVISSVEAPVEAPAAEQKPTLATEPTPVEQPRVAEKPPVQRPVFQPKPKPAPKPEPEPEPPAAPYCPPPIHLLDEPKRGAAADHSAEIEEKISILRTTLEDFHIHIKEQVDYSRGPTITRYEVRPEGGVSVRQFQNRADDISMYMSAPVRIAPVPGKPAVGIEVPNTVRDMVHIRTMLESEQFKNSQKLLEVPLGLGIGGEYQFCDIASMPHLLIAGSTGSGKSVCINTILLSLIYKTTPDDLRLILIDPKQVEFTPYEHIPHLYMPIINDMQRASGALACAVQEMERRFSIMRDVETRDIARYNEKVKNDPEREHLPRIVIIIDEFAELKMNSTNNDPEVYACRIAQKARAAGIHLIIGTQRPSVDVITGVLKANIGSRIAFSVRSQIDSRTILDSVGAEMLAGKGDMLFAPSNSTEKNPRRIQGAFVSDEELGRVVDYVIRHNDPVRYNQGFMERIEMEVARAVKAEQKGDYDADDGEEGGEDPKLIEAVQLAVETQKVATSLLQRRLGVGYGRAAKIIDRMEELGLVSAAEGNKPRKLLPAAQGYLDHIAGGADAYGDGYDEGDGSYE